MLQRLRYLFDSSNPLEPRSRARCGNGWKKSCKFRSSMTTEWPKHAPLLRMLFCRANALPAPWDVLVDWRFGSLAPQARWPRQGLKEKSPSGELLFSRDTTTTRALTAPPFTMAGSRRVMWAAWIRMETCLWLAA